MIAFLKFILIIGFCIGFIKFLDFYSDKVVTIAMSVADQYDSRLYGLGVATIGICFGVFIMAGALTVLFNVDKRIK
jgi:hypothetical protein